VLRPGCEIQERGERSLREKLNIVEGVVRMTLALTLLAEHVDILGSRVELSSIYQRLEEAVVRTGEVCANSTVVTGIPEQVTVRIATRVGVSHRVPGTGEYIR